MFTWREVWRKGLSRELPTQGLRALAHALRVGDLRVIQGVTTQPPPLAVLANCPIEAACALGFCGWQGYGLRTVAQVEDFHARVCRSADERLACEDASRRFLTWFDETPAAEMRRQLLAEVERTLADRQTLAA